MLATTLQLISAAMIGQFSYGNYMPIPEEHLKAPQGERRVSLIMDVSGSMYWGNRNEPCAWFNNTALHPQYNDPTNGTGLNKNEQMKAAAVGCAFQNDGFLDAWASQVDFAIVGFGYGSPPYIRQLMGGVFTRDLALLESTILNLPAEGSTPLQWGLLEGGRIHNDYWSVTRPNAYECDQHFAVLMTDGVPNDCGGWCDTPAYNHVPCSSPAGFNPFVPPVFTGPFSHYNYCNTPAYCDIVGAAGYYRYDNELPDAVCNGSGPPGPGVGGVQNVTTYTIGFGDPGDLDENLLRAVALRGGGQYYGAQSAGQLSSVFNEILNNIITRTGRFTPPSIQTDGLYVGNQSYSAQFKAIPGGPWIGNLKTHCVVPDLLPTGAYETEAANNDCLFVHRTPPFGYTGNAGTYLETNAQPQDGFSPSATLEADDGGVGYQIYQDYFNNQAPLYNAGGDAIAFANEFGSLTDPLDFFRSGPHTHRTILTWTSPTSGYVPVYNLTDAQMIASGCHRTRLLAYLYGYDPETVDCVTNRPTQLSRWPLGAAVNAHPTILRWGDDCSIAGRCLVALNMDDGGIHFFDTADGHEYAMVIPKQLFTPATTANYPLSTVLDQPTLEMARRPFLNGGMFRVHDDRNADGIINGSETALLVFSLGYGGAGYYFMDVSRQFTVPDSNDNPIYPVVATPDSWTRNLKNAIARPWVGRVQYGALTSPVITAVIPSGGVWYQDRPDEPFNVDAIGLKPGLDPTDPTTLTTLSCPDFATYNGLDAVGFDVCTDGYSPIGFIDFGIAGSCTPGDWNYRTAPLWYSEGFFPNDVPAGAIGRITFPVFDLDDGGNPANPADYVVLEDLDGNELTPRLSGTRANLLGAPFVWDVWVTARPFIIRLHVDGVCTGNQGVMIGSLQYAKDRLFGSCGGGDPCEACDINDNGQCTSSPGECNPGSTQQVLQACARCDTDGNGNCSGIAECGRHTDPADCGVHDPFIAFINLSRINGPGAISSRPPAQMFADSVADGGTPLLFTRNCPVTAPAFSGTCYDQNTPPSFGATVGTADLQYMRCPIVAEVRAYEEGGIAKAFYVGDQCGQMWKIWNENGGSAWNAKRLFVTNVLTPGGYESRTYRRFDRPVDLVISQCKGNRSIGVYFGTGNTARPAALDNLELPAAEADIVTAVTAARVPARVRNHNVVGAFFDAGQWNTGVSRSLNNFQDVTPLNAAEAAVPFSTANDGWYWALLDDEQMLRDPTVFNGIAYFKTNTGLTQITTCRPGTTLDRVYAVNNCSSLPADPSHPNSGTAGRQQWAGEQDVGGNLILYTPKEGPPIVSVGDVSGSSPANLVTPPQNVRTLQMLFRWRVY